MAAENMIVPSSLVKQLANGFDITPSKRGYVAPTVFKLAGVTFSGYNYYKTLDQAWEKLRYMCGISGAKNVSPAGSIPFSGSAAQTLGINVDFFVGLSETQYSPAHYLFVKAAIQNLNNKFYFAYRFYKTDGTGPFYAVFDPKLFSLAATTVNNVNDASLLQLDDFYRSVNLLKFQHNALVSFMNEQIKFPVTPARQMTINQGQMAISNMRGQISTIKGLEVQYLNAGGIGVVMLAPLVWWAIAAVVAAWSVSAILTEVQKTKRISSAFDFQKWVADHKLRLAQEAQAGTISQADAAALSKQADDASKTAGKVATNISSGSSMFGDIADILKWGLVGLIGFKLLDTLPAKKS